jgi:sulfatase modifying factor 1
MRPHVWADRFRLLPWLVVLSGAAMAVPPTMIRVPAGEAQIGSDRGRPDESPAFQTPVSAFEMDRTPVTVAAFSRFVKQQGYRTEAETLGSGAVMTFGTGQWQLVPGATWRRPQGPKGEAAIADHPVTQVSWNDAAAYCAAQGKRLPSEVEYEYASRLGAPPGSAHAFGDALVQGGHYRANVWTGVFPMLNTAKDGYRTTSPVGAFGAGPLGFTDLAGNVWEWTSDWYRPYAERQQAWPADRVGEKVQRGGSFLCDPGACYGFRVTARGHATPDSAHMHVGFRCARDVPVSAAFRSAR